MNYNKPNPLIAVAHPTLFTPLELDAFEREILANPNATEHDASNFFARFPRFLLQGRSQELRREAVLLGPDNKPIGRVDFFRRSFGAEYWDLIELKHPKSRVVVAEKGGHPRFSAHVYAAINQAEDYREWIQQDATMREDLMRKGIVVNHPRVWIVAGRPDASVSEASLQKLRSRIQDGGVEFSTYVDLYRFAKEHYQSTKVIVYAATLHEVSWPLAEFHRDREGHFIYANEPLANLFGTTPEAIIGKTDKDLMMNAEQVRQFRELDEQVMATGNPQEAEERFVDKSGHQVLLHTMKLPLRNTKGEIIGVSGIIKRLS